MRTNLILWEKRNGFKAKYVAGQLGITEGAYSRIKAGKMKPSIDFAYKFLKAFEPLIPNGNVLELLKEE